jgi:hypothetical protein
MLGDFNLNNCDWINGAPLPNSYCYNKIKGNFHKATCFLGHVQRNNSSIHTALLDLVFSKFSDLSAGISSSPVVTPDKYHPPLLGFNLTIDCHRVSLTAHSSCAQGDFLLLYVLRHSDWSCVLNENSYDSAVNHITA